MKKVELERKQGGSEGKIWGENKTKSCLDKDDGCRKARKTKLQGKQDEGDGGETRRGIKESRKEGTKRGE